MAVALNIKTTNNYFERTDTLVKYYHDADSYEVIDADHEKELFTLLKIGKINLEEAKKNDWIDPQGIRYVVFPKRQIQEELDCSRYWVDQFTKELETMGLIKLGYLYKPVIERRFYVRTFSDDIPRILVEYVRGRAPDTRPGSVQEGS